MERAMENKFNITKPTLYRIVYFLLLCVLLPHTAWAFAKFEPPTPIGIATAWTAAIFFEMVIAILTEKLAERISVRIRKRTEEGWFSFNLRRMNFRYGNSYFGGLLIAWVVSSLANLGHAVEFGTEMVIFTQYGIPFGVYALSFGAILPTASLLFASVLSNEVVSEPEVNQSEQRLKKQITELKASERQLNKELERVKASEQRVNESEQRVNNELVKLRASEQQLKSQVAKLNESEQRLKTELESLKANHAHLVGFSSESKRDQIIAIHKQWPDLPNTVIELMTGSSRSHISQTLKYANGREVTS